MCVSVKRLGWWDYSAEYVTTEAVALMAWLLCCAATSRVHKSLWRRGQRHPGRRGRGTYIVSHSLSKVSVP